jgi:hypothetical protein
VAAFDAGAITSDIGALLLDATDGAIKMMDQGVFGLALGYESAGSCFRLPVARR